MGVLRNHRDSLMAMLEAFIHDPLIKWRLLQPENPNERARSRSASCMGGHLTAGGGTVASGAAGTGTQAPTASCGPGQRDSAGLSLSRSRRQSLAPSLRASLEESFGYNSADPLQMSVPDPHTPHESMRRRSMAIPGSHLLGIRATGEDPEEPEALNERAVRVIRRVDNKLTGREFGEEHSVSQQVQRLIEAATSHQALCALFVGWCPFW